MADGVEEEELGDDKGLHEHDGARGDDGDKANYVHHTDGVENDIPRTSQGAFDERHFFSSCRNRKTLSEGLWRRFRMVLR